MGPALRGSRGTHGCFDCDSVLQILCHYAVGRKGEVRRVKNKQRKIQEMGKEANVFSSVY